MGGVARTWHCHSAFHLALHLDTPRWSDFLRACILGPHANKSSPLGKANRTDVFKFSKAHH